MHSGFFDAYPNFYKTSKTASSPSRLNHRYEALINWNKDLIKNARILDIGSHDGRWTFAALKNGASHVLGIEARHHLAEHARSNMKQYGISESSYDFVEADAFEYIPTIEPNAFDVVFCFGFFYHIVDHFNLIKEIKRMNPKYLILDTAITINSQPVIELRKEIPDKEGGAINNFRNNLEWVVVGYPSKLAVELILTSHGFAFKYYDWLTKCIQDWTDITDYRDIALALLDMLWRGT